MWRYCFAGILAADRVLAVAGILTAASVLAFPGILAVTRIPDVACIPAVVGVLYLILLNTDVTSGRRILQVFFIRFFCFVPTVSQLKRIF